MSYLQRYVSMFVYIFPYAAYEGMKSLTASHSMSLITHGDEENNVSTTARNMNM